MYIDHSLIVNKPLTKDTSPKTTPVLRLPLGNLAVHICVNKPLTRHLSAESTHIWSLPSCRTYCSYFHVSNPLNKKTYCSHFHVNNPLNKDNVHHQTTPILRPPSSKQHSSHFCVYISNYLAAFQPRNSHCIIMILKIKSVTPSATFPKILRWNKINQLKIKQMSDSLCMTIINLYLKRNWKNEVELARKVNITKAVFTIGSGTHNAIFWPTLYLKEEIVYDFRL